jgi:hypothetical protein
MSLTSGLMMAFVASFAIGLGVGVVMKSVNNLVRWCTSTSED